MGMLRLVERENIVTFLVFLFSTLILCFDLTLFFLHNKVLSASSAH